MLRKESIKIGIQKRKNERKKRNEQKTKEKFKEVSAIRNVPHFTTYEKLKMNRNDLMIQRYLKTFLRRQVRYIYL